MRIKLDDKHYLCSDPYCYWITCEVTYKGRDGKEKTTDRRVSGYSRNFSEAVESFIEKKIKSSEASNLAELKDDIEQLKSTVLKWRRE